MAPGSELVRFVAENNEAFRSFARLTTLYSDFPTQRATNPDGYAANITAWKKALCLAAQAGRLPVPQEKGVRSALKIPSLDSGDGDGFSSSTSGVNPFLLYSGSDLLAAFDNGALGQPRALGNVISDLAEKSDIVPISSYIHSRDGSSVGSGLVSAVMPWNIAMWGLRQVGLFGGSSMKALPQETYVIKENLQFTAKEVLAYIRSQTSALSYTIHTLSDLLATALPYGDSLSPLAMQLLLLYMTRDMNPPAASYSPSSKVVKFSNFQNSLGPITEADIQTAQLRSIIQSTSLSTAALDARVDTLKEDIKKALAAENRPRALAALRKRKLLEGSLEKRRDMILQLEEVLLSIEEASTRVDTVRELAGSAEVLKSLNLATGGPEAVERIMDRLQEERDAGAEIATAFNEANTVAIDEGEVESELLQLEALMDEKKRAEARAEEEESLRAGEELERRLAGLRPVASREEPERVSSPDELLSQIGRLALA